jgi:tRNA(Phe) wybutosine-synthesizing methylase Tyw3
MELDGCTFPVDEKIYPAVKWLNSLDCVKTTYSCQGGIYNIHGYDQEQPPHIYFRTENNNSLDQIREVLRKVSKKCTNDRREELSLNKMENFTLEREWTVYELSLGNQDSLHEFNNYLEPENKVWQELIDASWGKSKGNE